MIAVHDSQLAAAAAAAAATITSFNMPQNTGMQGRARGVGSRAGSPKIVVG